MIRLLLVDDQKSVREHLRAMLTQAQDIELVGTASDGAMAVEQAEILQPDVVLIDIEMPGMDGLIAAQSICKQCPRAKVLFLSSHNSNAYILKAIQAGAKGYLLKSTPADQLQESIRYVHLGYAQFGPGVIENVVPLNNPSVTTPSSSTPSKNKTSEQFNGFNRAPDKPNPELNFLELEPRFSHLASLHQPVLETVPASSQSLYLLPLGDDQRKTQERILPFSSPKNRGVWYTLSGLVCNSLIWGLGLAYLLVSKPVFMSQWTVSLPNSSSSTSVSLPGIGEARSDSDSPYQSNISDPRENYKFLMGSDSVLELAANQLNLSKKLLETPEVKILANTTLLQFSLSGPSAMEAQRRAMAFKDAFSQRIEQLRKEEVNQQDSSLQNSYEIAKQKLDLAQAKLADFKARSGLGSSDQLQDLSTTIEGLRRQQAETIAKLRDLEANSRELSLAINLSPQQAADAVALKSNSVFQQYLNIYKNTNTELINLTTQYSDSHPLVVDQRENRRQAESKLSLQAQSLLGRPIQLSELSLLGLENTSGNSERSELFQQLIQLQGEKRGLSAQSRGLEDQIKLLEARLASLTKKAATLTSLQRDAQRAEAVYSSTATRLDLSNADISASYPPISDVTLPSLPTEPSSPMVKLALAGMILASLFVSLGFTLLLLRNRKLINQAKVLHNRSSLPL